MECLAERPGHLHYKIMADFSVQPECRATDGAQKLLLLESLHSLLLKKCECLHYGACFSFLNASVPGWPAHSLSVWDHAITFSTELETVTFVYNMLAGCLMGLGTQRCHGSEESQKSEPRDELHVCYKARGDYMSLGH